MQQAEVAETGSNRLVEALRGTRQFLLDVRVEMRKVSWPTREELIDASKRVLLMTIAIGTLVGLLDLVLQKILIEGIAALTR